MSNTTTVSPPRTGTWVIDQAHSSVEAVARHLMVSRVRGRFTSFSGRVEVTDPAEESPVEVTIDAASIDTGEPQRDEHLRSADFLDVENHPTLTFRGQGARRNDDGTWTLPGELTVRGMARPVDLEVEYQGIVTDPWGTEHAAFSAATELDREEFGMTWNQALETGGVLVGKKLKVELDVQLVPES